MPHRDWSIRIEDILEACRRIVEYVSDMDELNRPSLLINVLVLGGDLSSCHYISSNFPVQPLP